MYKTQKEILNQPTALKQTYNLVIDNKDEIKSFFKDVKKVVFTGCGSSYSLCKSAAISMNLTTEIESYSIAAGDAMINFDYYEKIFKDAVIVAPSRSGSTSEVVNLVKIAQEKYNTKCMCICAKENSDLSKMSQISIEIPWAFDESVCQTRTVTNLYTINLLISAIISNNDSLINEISKAINNSDDFISSYKDTLKEIGELKSWNKAVVLADAELEGIAEEGALAFKEICQLPSNYYHVLDSRHGPMVLYDKKTLIIAVLSPNDKKYQKDFIKDVKDNDCVVVTVSEDKQNIWDSNYHITIKDYDNFSTAGINFIAIPQLISLHKALENGINPDLPKGLDPWIKL